MVIATNYSYLPWTDKPFFLCMDPKKFLFISKLYDAMKTNYMKRRLATQPMLLIRQSSQF